MPKVTLHCTCGASMTGSLGGPMAEPIQRFWDQTHTGPGHAPCDARKAARARKKTEAQGQRSETWDVAGNARETSFQLREDGRHA